MGVASLKVTLARTCRSKRNTHRARELVEELIRVDGKTRVGHADVIARITLAETPIKHADGALRVKVCESLVRHADRALQVRRKKFTEIRTDTRTGALRIRRRKIKL